jgi:7-cyano-7-deazaguanine synthase
MEKLKKALVIFSGGQDSTTCLGWAINRFTKVQTISFYYGQKHSKEIDAAEGICRFLRIEQKIIDISFFGSLVDSALTHSGNVNLKHKRLKNLPASFVPNRNAMFLTIAHAYAQTIKADCLIFGASQTDYSGYPDCRDVFVKTIGKALNLGSESNIGIITPLMKLDKRQTWELAEKEGIYDIALRYSMTCYNGTEKMNPWGKGCGECPACKLRAKGFNEYVRSKETN